MRHCDQRIPMNSLVVSFQRIRQGPPRCLTLVTDRVKWRQIAYERRIGYCLVMPHAVRGHYVIPLSVRLSQGAAALGAQLP